LFGSQAHSPQNFSLQFLRTILKKKFHPLVGARSLETRTQ
jgi:hypothetical protein